MWWVFLSAASAGDLYINGTVVEPRAVVDVKLERATVWFDALGNIHVDAPEYTVKVEGPPVVPAPARWWLATEDGGSAGQVIEVWINGQLAQVVRSAEPQKIVDLGRWLHVGPNEVEVRSKPTNPSGGTLYVYVGTGADRAGTVVIDEPTVQFGVSASRREPYSQTYTLTVDR